MTDNKAINIAGKDKAEILRALYNAARPMGMGMLRARDGDMTLEEARNIVENGSSADYPGPPQKGYFDYLHGRPLKTDISGDILRVDGFDRDHGDGAARRALIAASIIAE